MTEEATESTPEKDESSRKKKESSSPETDKEERRSSSLPSVRTILEQQAKEGKITIDPMTMMLLMHQMRADERADELHRLELEDRRRRWEIEDQQRREQQKQNNVLPSDVQKQLEIIQKSNDELRAELRLKEQREEEDRRVKEAVKDAVSQTREEFRPYAEKANEIEAKLELLRRTPVSEERKDETLKDFAADLVLEDVKQRLKDTVKKGFSEEEVARTPEGAVDLQKTALKYVNKGLGIVDKFVEKLPPLGQKPPPPQPVKLMEIPKLPPVEATSPPPKAAQPDESSEPPHPEQMPTNIPAPLTSQASLPSLSQPTEPVNASRLKGKTTAKPKALDKGVVSQVSETVGPGAAIIQPTRLSNPAPTRRKKARKPKSR